MASLCRATLACLTCIYLLHFALQSDTVPHVALVLFLRDAAHICARHSCRSCYCVLTLFKSRLIQSDGVWASEADA